MYWSTVKCYHCQKYGHKSNIPKERISEVLWEPREMDESYASSGRSEGASYITHFILLEYRIQYNGLIYFCTRGTFKGKKCNIIINNGSIDNLISGKEARNENFHWRTTQNHTNWNGDEVKVRYVCDVPLSIEKRYSDTISCDMPRWMQPTFYLAILGNSMPMPPIEGD